MVEKKIRMNLRGHMSCKATKNWICSDRKSGSKREYWEQPEQQVKNCLCFEYVEVELFIYDNLVVSMNEWVKARKGTLRCLCLRDFFLENQWCLHCQMFPLCILDFLQPWDKEKNIQIFFFSWIREIIDVSNSLD